MQGERIRELVAMWQILAVFAGLFGFLVGTATNIDVGAVSALFVFTPMAVAAAWAFCKGMI